MYGILQWKFCIWHVKLWINAEISGQNQWGICHPRHYYDNITNIWSLGRVVRRRVKITQGNLNSDMRAYKSNSVKLSLPTICWSDTLKIIEKIMRESAFDKKKKKTGLKFHPGLALTDIWTTGHWCFARTNSNIKYLLAKGSGRGGSSI